MREDKQVLVINPGSTSTKIAVFLGEECIASASLSHSAEEGLMKTIIHLKSFML